MKGFTLSPKSQAALYCEHVSPKGRRCHMLLNPNHASINGNAQPSLCAYHANSSNLSITTPDPETVAANLLRGISQLLLTTFPAMQREREDAANHVDLSKELFGGLRQPPQADPEAEQSAEPVAMGGRSALNAPAVENGRA